MALQFTRTDAATGHTWTVYAKIDKATVILGAETTITLNLYDNNTAATQGLQPVLPPDVVTLTAEEMTGINSGFVIALAAAAQAGQILSPSDALKTALYTLVKARDAYSGAISV